MNLASAILVVLTSLPRHFSDADEPREDRIERLGIVANSIESAVNLATCTNQPRECLPLYHGRIELAGVLVSMGFMESTFARHVHAGECGPHECDKGRAVGLWQIHRRTAWDDSTWASMSGIDGTESSAVVVASLMATNIKECKSIAGAFGRYATGHGCPSKYFELREKNARVMAEKIRKAMRQ